MSLAADTIAASRPWRLILPPLLALLVGTALRYGLYESSYGGGGFSAYLRAICVLDCDWYESIVRQGYDLTAARHVEGDGANWAFFPLLPMLVWALSQIMAGDVLLAAFVLSSSATLATAYLARPLLTERAWWLFFVFLFIGPFSFHFSTLYTESLFMALTLWGFATLRAHRYERTGFIGALLSATRSTGVFLSLSMALQAVLEGRRRGLGWLNAVFAALRRSDVILGVIIAPLGLFAFMAFLALHMGDGLAFAHVQVSWGRTLGNPLLYLWNGLLEPAGPGQWVGFNRAWATFAILGFALCAELARRGQWPEALFCTLTLLVPLMTEIFSMTRFVIGLSPLMVLLMGLLASRVWLTLLAAALFVIADIALLPHWLAASFYLM